MSSLVGSLSKVGAEGVLLVSGPNVMQGYWNLPENNARAFWTDSDGIKWYHTVLDWLDRWSQ